MRTKRSPRKKKSIRRRKKSEITKIQEKLWNLCKQIIRLRYRNEDGTFTCYTCQRRLTALADCHTSHLWPKGSLGANLKYELKILRITCYNCNINLGGNGAVFYKRMVEENGQAYMDELEAMKGLTIPNRKAYYQSLIESYTTMLNQMTLKELVDDTVHEVEVDGIVQTGSWWPEDHDGTRRDSRDSIHY